MKPAEQSSVIGAKLMECLRDAGVPPGVANYLPGLGEEIGPTLTNHPDVAVIAFTGSLKVGLTINEQASRTPGGQNLVKRVIAEMGGKNAIIVDADADLDEAVKGAVDSAFGYAGQKCSACSRLIVVDSVYDELVRRLVGATRSLRVGHPREMGTQVGPLIDADAHKRVSAYVDAASSEGAVVLARNDVPDEGFFVGPAIVTDVHPQSRLAREEIFGPVLVVLRADSFEAAVALANDTDYALTAGVFSRSPANIRFAFAELRGGNVYVNRTTVGAVVGRQPFGGYGLSGVGSKAGGPDYLMQFVEPRVVTENTLRQGFAPPDE